MKIMNTKTTREAYVRALLYGQSGTGKTTSIRTLPLSDTLAILTEPKFLPLLGHDVDIIPIQSWPEIQEVLAFCRAGLNAKEGLVVNGHKKDIIVIDSLSETNEICKEHIVGIDRPAVMKAAGRKAGSSGLYDDQLEQRDWGVLATRLDSLVGAFTHLPCHVIITCGEKWTEDKQTGEIFVTPDLNGKLATGIAHKFDEVYRLVVKANAEGAMDRFFLTSRTPKELAKGSERLDKLEPADWSAVLSKIFAARGEESKGKKK